MFEIKKSSLRLIEFFLLENQFSVKSKGISSAKDVEQFFDSYPISIDFAHQDTESDEFHVFVMVKVNNGKKYLDILYYVMAWGYLSCHPIQLRRILQFTRTLNYIQL